MKKLALGLLLGICGTLLGVLILSSIQERGPVSFILQPTPVPTPLAVYSLEQLKGTTFVPTDFKLGRIVKENADSLSQLFTFSFYPKPGSTEQKTISGLANVPKKPGNYPLILMLRGYVPLEIFSSGVGTQPAASVFVKNGYITLAPDFLGFGESDPKASDPYESRFQTYTTTLSLFASLSNLQSALDASYSGSLRVDTERTGIWAHSNGGHIALTTLGISGKSFPTVLWAPVSKPFPYSILYYSDEDDDGGKEERRELGRFESIYDTEAFSPPTMYATITAPLEIHQGTIDEEVPVWWSRELVKSLREKSISIDYHEHAGSDHNLRPAWNTVVQKNVEFYAKHL